VAFATVVTAEIALLADEEAELTIRKNLFLVSVSHESLGGGWDTNLLPTQTELVRILASAAARSSIDFY
jgi:hypothetical protein